MNPIRAIRRPAALLAGLAGVLLAFIAAAPASFAAPPPGAPAPGSLPHLPPGYFKHPPLPGPAHVHAAALATGMPGWQISLIAAGAAVLAAAIAVFLYRAVTAHRHVTASAA
jgi:hypothetical protein